MHFLTFQRLCDLIFDTMKHAFAPLVFQMLHFSLYQANGTSRGNYPDISLRLLETAPSIFSSDYESY